MKRGLVAVWAKQVYKYLVRDDRFLGGPRRQESAVGRCQDAMNKGIEAPPPPCPCRDPSRGGRCGGFWLRAAKGKR